MIPRSQQRYRVHEGLGSTVLARIGDVPQTIAFDGAFHSIDGFEIEIDDDQLWRLDSSLLIPTDYVPDDLTIRVAMTKDGALTAYGRNPVGTYPSTEVDGDGKYLLHVVHLLSPPPGMDINGLIVRVRIDVNHGPPLVLSHPYSHLIATKLAELAEAPSPFSDDFNRPDGALGPPWVDNIGNPLTTSDAEIVSNQAALSQFSVANFALTGRVPTQLAFTVTAIGSHGGSADVYLATLWSKYNGSAPFGVLAVNALYTAYGVYPLSSPITAGSHVAVDYGSGGVVTVTVDGDVRLTHDAFTLAAGSTPELATFSQDVIGLITADATIAYDDVTIAWV